MDWSGTMSPKARLSGNKGTIRLLESMGRQIDEIKGRLMLYKHYSDFDGEWRWNNFDIKKLSCRCCGEYWHDPDALDKLQAARSAAGKAFIINSGHRCKKHNADEGGRKNSAHLRIAFDIKIPTGMGRKEFLTYLFFAGFTTFGMYSSFVHTDPRSYRKWYGCNPKIWGKIYDEVVKK